MKISKDLIYCLVIVVLIALCGQFYYSYSYQPNHEIEVFYNQNIQANEKVISVIRDADKFVYAAIYTFTRQDIKNALLAAKLRGLDVKIILDSGQSDKVEQQKKIVKELQEAGIKVGFQDHSGLMHIKTVVTDKAYASGSYNWTASATTINDEVLEVGTDEKVRHQYENVLKELFNRYIVL